MATAATACPPRCTQYGTSPLHRAPGPSVATTAPSVWTVVRHGNVPWAVGFCRTMRCLAVSEGIVTTAYSSPELRAAAETLQNGLWSPRSACVCLKWSWDAQNAIPKPQNKTELTFRDHQNIQPPIPRCQKLRQRHLVLLDAGAAGDEARVRYGQTGSAVTDEWGMERGKGYTECTIAGVVFITVFVLWHVSRSLADIGARARGGADVQSTNKASTAEVTEKDAQHARRMRSLTYGGTPP